MVSALRISSAIEQGIMKVENLDYRKYSKVMDNIRKHLSRLGTKLEHAVKKGDTELIALVIQLSKEGKEKVFVSTLDKRLLRVLEPFSHEVDYEILETL
jgi:hypothetical protein